MFDKRVFTTFLGMLALSTAIKPDNICVLVTDGTKIVDDKDCAGFYTCYGGIAILSSCPNGQYFSKDHRGCVPKSQASCVGLGDNPCEGIIGERFVGMPNSCSGYYYCNNSDAHAGACPGGLNFNVHGQSCQYHDEYGCSGDASNTVDKYPNLLCAYIPNGMYFGSAANCRNWFKCTDNILKSGTCGDFVFNVQSQTCDYEGKYDCQQLKGDAGETGGSTAQSCFVENEVKAHPGSCSSYLRCVNKKYVTMKCPTGLYYDSDTSVCTNRLNAKNDCDRCEGTMMKFVNVYNDNCEGYLICSDGKTVGRGTCGEGNYFNEIYEGCVKGTSPEFAVCKVLPICPNCETYDPYNFCGADCVCVDGCPEPLPSLCNGCANTESTTTCAYNSGECTCDICQECEVCCYGGDYGENICAGGDVECEHCILNTYT